MKITEEMFQKYLKVNKCNNGKRLDFDTYKKSGLDVNDYIYISDHYEELKKKFQKDM